MKHYAVAGCPPAAAGPPPGGPLALDGSVHYNSGSGSVHNLPGLTTVNGNIVLVAAIVSNASPVVSVEGPGVSFSKLAESVVAASNIELWTGIRAAAFNNEVVTVTTTGSGFTTVDLIGVANCNYPNYQDSHISTPLGSSAQSVIYSTAENDTFTFNAYRLNTSSNTPIPGWTEISNVDFLLSQYKIESAPVVDESVNRSGTNGVVLNAMFQ